MNKLLLCLLLVSSSNLYSENTPVLSDREELQALLKERRERFDGYISSLQEKSGFFGGKSKKDLMKSQGILAEIVRLDNKMISILNRQLDYKKFEKTELTYQSLDNQEKQNQLSAELAASQKEVHKLQQKEKYLTTIIRLRTTVMWGAILSLLSVLLLSVFRRRKASEAGNAF